MQVGDVLLCPDGTGKYHVGEIAGDYYYKEGEVLFHRRPVRWLNTTVERVLMSESLRNSTGSIGTCGQITRHAAEIEALLSGVRGPILLTNDASIQDPLPFALEAHL
ncbi:MAG: hypothetical protein SGJ05_00390 [bacterium]|nr:hypothetical protein [bacterium]